MPDTETFKIKILRECNQKIEKGKRRRFDSYRSTEIIKDLHLYIKEIEISVEKWVKKNVPK